MRSESVKRRPWKKSPAVEMAKKEHAVGEYVVAVSFSDYSAIACSLMEPCVPPRAMATIWAMQRAHQGAIVCARSYKDGDRLITGVRSGEIRLISGNETTLLLEPKVPLGDFGCCDRREWALAYAAGKRLRLSGLFGQPLIFR